MSSSSTKMDLFLPSTADLFKTSDVTANWNKIDAAPGSLICTSTTRPSWDIAKAGRLIWETDTNLEWLWTGAAWQRTIGSGLLFASGGSRAWAERTTTLTWSGTSIVTVVALSSVVVPGGYRPLQVRVRWPQAQRVSPTGSMNGSLTLGGSPVGDYFMIGYNSVTDGSVSAGQVRVGGTYVYDIPTGLAPGTYDFGFTVLNDDADGSSTIQAATGGYSPTIAVVEL